METSTAKRHRTYGPNKSAVLHAVGDLRLVSNGRGRGEGGRGGEGRGGGSGQSLLNVG